METPFQGFGDCRHLRPEGRSCVPCFLLIHWIIFFCLIQGSQSLAVRMIGGGFLSPSLPFFTLIPILTVYCSYPYSIVKVISLEQLLISKHSRKIKQNTSIGWEVEGASGEHGLRRPHRLSRLRRLGMTRWILWEASDTKGLSLV